MDQRHTTAAQSLYEMEYQSPGIGAAWANQPRHNVNETRLIRKALPQRQNAVYNKNIELNGRNIIFS